MNRWSFISVTLLFFGLIVYLSIPTSASKERYHQMMEGRVRPEGETPYFSQEREGVKKELVLSGDERLKATLVAPRSTLLLEKEGEESDIVEKLGKFNCLFQEEIRPSKTDPGEKEQVVRVVSAAGGDFFYHKELLTAGGVFVSKYLVPGEELPSRAMLKDPLFKGVAKSADLSFKSGFHISFKHLKATFFEEETP